MRKDKAWKRCRECPTDINKSLYYDSMTRVTDQLRQARQTHQDMVRDRLYQRNMTDKMWWCTIKQAGGIGRGSSIPVLTGADGTECIANQQKAECLAQYFASKCSLKDDFTDDSLPIVDKPGPDTLCTVRFRPSAVKRALRQLDSSKATGPGGIPAKVLKQAAAELASPLAHLFTQCFESGVQPSSWKTARVVPIYKRKSKSSPKNYRPVSLLPIVSKVMEGIANRQIVNFLEAHHLLSDQQFGFRRGLGAADLLARLQHEWSLALAQSGEVHILAADIAGAFDKASHRGVLHKAVQYGLSGKLLAWLSSYLSNRHLQVVVSGQQSSLMPIHAGVPQGSILGPTLFLLYVNDCESHLPNGVKLAVYADDTTLYKCVPDSGALRDCNADLQEAVQALSTWGSKWKIQFEPTKSQALVLSHHRPMWQHQALQFDGVTVQEEESLKLLGVVFDRQLAFRNHIRSVAIRGNQRLYFLRRAAPLLDIRGREKAYNGFVRPVLEYCPLAWMGASISTLAQLDAVQHRALKIISSETWLPSLAIRRTVAALCYVYKLLCLPPHSPLQSLVPKRSTPGPQLYATRHRSTDCPHQHQLEPSVPFSSRNTVLHSFPTGVLDTWNSLPSSLFHDELHLKKLQTFKVKVYHYLRKSKWEWATTRR